MTLYLAGHVTPGLEELVNRTFGSIDIDSSRGVELKFVPFGSENDSRRLIEMEGVLQSAVRMGIPTISRQHPDYIELRLLVMALGGYFGSRLMGQRFFLLHTVLSARTSRRGADADSHLDRQPICRCRYR